MCCLLKFGGVAGEPPPGYQISPQVDCTIILQLPSSDLVAKLLGFGRTISFAAPLTPDFTSRGEVVSQAAPGSGLGQSQLRRLHGCHELVEPGYCKFVCS